MGDCHPILLFDGLCNLCSRSVDFVIDRDPGSTFRFAALQSDAGRRLLRERGVDAAGLGTLVLLEGNRTYARSTAALRAARRLRGLWPLVYGLIVVPRPIRDVVYDWIARHRYRWFGRRPVCRTPTPELMGRFIV